MDLLPAIAGALVMSQAPAVTSAPGLVLKLAPPKPRVMDAPGAAEIGAVQAKASRRGLTPVGMHRDVDFVKHGQWTTLKDGRRLWRVAFQSETAKGVRLRFTQFDVGPGGRVWVHSPDGKEGFGPYRGKGPNGDGDFWADTVLTHSVVIEYVPGWGSSATGAVPFEVKQISHLFRSPLEDGR